MVGMVDGGYIVYGGYGRWGVDVVRCVGAMVLGGYIVGGGLGGCG